VELAASIFRSQVSWITLTQKMHTARIYLFVVRLNTMSLPFAIEAEWNICIFMAQQPPVSHGLLIVEASRLHSVRHTTFGRTPLDEWSARHTDLYHRTHNTEFSQCTLLHRTMYVSGVALHELRSATAASGRRIEVIGLQLFRTWTDKEGNKLTRKRTKWARG